MVAIACPAFAAPPPGLYKVYFPGKPDNADQEIQRLNLKVSCGHIEAIVGIPDDWNVSVSRSISAVEHLTATEGHGASHLRGLSRLDGMIFVREKPGDASCFAVSASVLMSFDTPHTVHFGPRRIRLVTTRLQH
jgi:hypothetical protein